jgi:hypothetical protein
MIPRRPGQFARERAVRLAIPVAALLVVAVVLAVVGLLRQWWPFSLLAWLVLWLEYRWEKGGRDPVPWMAGARGEQAVAGVLDELKSEGFRSVHDLDIGRGNVDHVVAGPTGVFLIETKSVKANLYPKSGRLMTANTDRTAWVKQATRCAMEVKRRLGLAGMDRFVPAIIVSTRGKVLRKPLTFGNVDVIELADLADHIRRPRAQSLDERDIARAIAAVLRGDQPVSVRSIDMVQ